MAEAFLNASATEQGFKVRAESAGTVGGKSVNPIALEAMNEVGISVAGQTPKLLDPEMAARADRIVTMGCGVDAEACPVRILVTEDWGLDDPAGQSIERVREIRDQIRDRVDQLLTEMSS